MNSSKVMNFFPGGNTTQGFYSLYDYLPYYAENIFIIKGGPGTGKSTFMKKIGEAMLKEGYSLEYHWCSSDNNSLDGIVIKELEVAFLDGTAPHLIDPQYPGAVDQIIDLGQYWNRDLLKENRAEIRRLNDQIGEEFQKAYTDLAIAKSFYDKWESFYIAAVQQEKINYKLETLTTEIMENQPLAAQEGQARRLFASALTPQGPVNYLDSITNNLQRRYIIRGNPGTGKKELIKEIATRARKRGYQVNYYHCAFDPEKLDMIIIPQLDLALIDDHPPHELTKLRSGDKIVDMFSCVEERVLTKSHIERREAKENYQHLLSKAITKIGTAKELHDELEEYYITAMDFTAVNQLRDKLINNLCDQPITWS
ncbi:MAG: PRK06851 family protein [Bacillota bacterium]